MTTMILLINRRLTTSHNLRMAAAAIAFVSSVLGALAQETDRPALGPPGYGCKTEPYSYGVFKSCVEAYIEYRVFDAEKSYSEAIAKKEKVWSTPSQTRHSVAAELNTMVRADVEKCLHADSRSARGAQASYLADMYATYSTGALGHELYQDGNPTEAYKTQISIAKRSITCRDVIKLAEERAVIPDTAPPPIDAETLLRDNNSEQLMLLASRDFEIYADGNRYDQFLELSSIKGNGAADYRLYFGDIGSTGEEDHVVILGWIGEDRYWRAMTHLARSVRRLDKDGLHASDLVRSRAQKAFELVTEWDRDNPERRIVGKEVAADIAKIDVAYAPIPPTEIELETAANRALIESCSSEMLWVRYVRGDYCGERVSPATAAAGFSIYKFYPVDDRCGMEQENSSIEFRFSDTAIKSCTAADRNFLCEYSAVIDCRPGGVRSIDEQMCAHLILFTGGRSEGKATLTPIPGGLGWRFIPMCDPS